MSLKSVDFHRKTKETRTPITLMSELIIWKYFHSILSLCLCLAGSFSEVQSSNRLPIANLGNDELLSCYLYTTSEQTTFRQVSVTWEKEALSGVVYQYENGAADLKDQNSQYKGRTQLFPDALVKGNASLLLRGVRSSDEGEYTCQASTSDGGGQVNIHLRTAGKITRLSTFTVFALIMNLCENTCNCLS